MLDSLRSRFNVERVFAGVMGGLLGSILGAMQIQKMFRGSLSTTKPQRIQ